MKTLKLQGFTLIELLIVIALIAVLAGAVIIALNPARQFQLARNSERWSHVSALAGSITQRAAENRGTWPTAAGCEALPATSSTISAADTNICGCLVPSNVASLPFDPSVVGAGFTDCTTYNTGYTVAKDATTGRVTVEAPGAELGVTISVTQ